MNALAEFRDYDGLRRALNAVREYRDLALEDLDDLAGLPDRYSSKIFGPNAAKRVGMQSLGDLIGALGVKCILVEDPEAWARMQRQAKCKPRDRAHLAAVHAGTVHFQLSRGFLRKIQALGGKNSRKNLGKRQIKKLARKAANARWAKQRGQAKLAAHRANKKPT